MKLSLFNVRKALINNQIVLSKYVHEKIHRRGYSKRDLIKCIWTGEITNNHVSTGKLRVVLKGLDAHNNPVICIIGVNEKDAKQLKIFNLFPPISEDYKSVI